MANAWVVNRTGTIDFEEDEASYWMRDVEWVPGLPGAKRRRASSTRRSRQEEAKEAAKYHGLVKHDGNPETNLFDLKLDAGNSLDTDNDNFQYEWSQIGGSPLDIASTDSKVLYLQVPPGEYEFQLEVTDSYADSTSISQTVVIAEEPNVAPKASFSIKNESKGVYFDNGPSWQASPDSVKAFQANNKLTSDGLWGPASQKVYEKMEASKKTKTP